MLIWTTVCPIGTVQRIRQADFHFTPKMTSSHPNKENCVVQAPVTKNLTIIIFWTILETTNLIWWFLIEERVRVRYNKAHPARLNLFRMGKIWRHIVRVLSVLKDFWRRNQLFKCIYRVRKILYIIICTTSTVESVLDMEWESGIRRRILLSCHTTGNFNSN